MKTFEPPMWAPHETHAKLKCAVEMIDREITAVFICFMYKNDTLYCTVFSESGSCPSEFFLDSLLSGLGDTHPLGTACFTLLYSPGFSKMQFWSVCVKCRLKVKKQYYNIRNNVIIITGNM